MLPQLPILLSLLFGLTTLLTLAIFFWVLLGSTVKLKQKWIIIVVMILWLVAQAMISLAGIYATNTASLPPRILALGVLPALLVILFLFITKAGRLFIDGLPLKRLTWLHIVRVPVELLLYWLFLCKVVPQQMTFEGRNFDIIAGITAPIIILLAWRGPTVYRKLLLAWNLACLVLLINIVITALLAAPSPMQRIAFDQPNIAVLYFPFSWLPVFVVPVMLFAHLGAIRNCLKKPGEN